MEKWELAYQDYVNGMKYKDIAEKYDVSINTVKSWKSRKWGAPPEKRLHTKTKKVATKKKLQPVIENDDLTEQQKLFCLFYLQYFNATKAYREAYPEASYDTARTEGSRNLAKPSIKKELHRLKSELQQDIYADAEMLLNDLLKQAKSDITDYVRYFTVEEPLLDMFGGRVKDSETGQPVMVRRSYVEFKDMDQVDGSLIQEVKKGKDGISIKLVDKQKALLEVLKRVETTETLKTSLLEKQIQKAEAEILKLKSQSGDSDEELEEDGFLEALEAEGDELWQEE